MSARVSLTVYLHVYEDAKFEIYELNQDEQVWCVDFIDEEDRCVASGLFKEAALLRLRDTINAWEKEQKDE